MTETELAARAAQVLERLRETRPLVHHITNFVVMNDTAGQCLECCGTDELFAGARHHNRHFRSGLNQLAGQIGRLVGGNSACHPEENFSPLHNVDTLCNSAANTTERILYASAYLSARWMFRQSL